MYNKKILLKRNGGIGDILFAEPIINHLIQNGNTVYYNIGGKTDQLFDNHPYLNDKLFINKSCGDIDEQCELNYECNPKMHAQNAYALQLGLHDFIPTEPKVYLTDEEKINPYPNEKFAVLHIESIRGLNYREIYGVHWNKIVDYIENVLNIHVFQISSHRNINVYADVLKLNSIRDAFSYIYNCEFFIGLDSFPSIISAGLNKKTIIFFGSVNPIYRHADFSNIETIEMPCEYKYCYHDIKDSSRGPACRLVGDDGISKCTLYNDDIVINKIHKVLSIDNTKWDEYICDHIYTKNDITMIIPSRNNLIYLKKSYESLNKHNPELKFVLLDDKSDDGTYEYISELASDNNNVQIYRNDSKDTYGIGRLYNIGASMAKTKIIMFFHADMIASEHTIDNMLKHFLPHTVVSATRIEPPLHPAGPEKHIFDLGLMPNAFDHIGFNKIVNMMSIKYKDMTTLGIFAPWMILKEDFDSIGGHDYKLFKTMLEDSDIFNRFMLNGYKLIQSRDSLVYHMTCRGSRFKDFNGIGKPKDSDEYKELNIIATRNFIQKWHSLVKHDDLMLPEISPIYDIGLRVTNCTYDLLNAIEVFGKDIYIDNINVIDKYTHNYPAHANKIHHFNDISGNDIIISFDGNEFINDVNANSYILLELPTTIAQYGDIGMFDAGIFTLTIKSMNRLEKNNIVLSYND